MHEGRPVTSMYDPGVHASHTDKLLLLPAVPTAHATHDCAPVVF